MTHHRRNEKEYSAHHKEARRLYKDGWVVREIARKLGLNTTQVNIHIGDIKGGISDD